MNTLQGKKILIGITGGIAAYKVLSLIRLFVRGGAEVRVVMTDRAKDFVTPLTAATLSGHPVLSDFADLHSGQWHSHVELGLWADLYLIAPLTANTLSKMAAGAADNLLTTTYLSAKCPVMAAPSMDLDMYAHPSTRRNINTLEQDGVTILKAGDGFLASGLTGPGRLPEPQEIFDAVEAFFSDKKKTLYGKKVLITAGPTYEPIDPVRFIGNCSSGKMGIALADRAARLGAEVTLVCGPSGERTQMDSVRRIDVKTAAQMYRCTTDLFPECDIAILSAAVADYRPKSAATSKIKKKDSPLILELEATEDILAALGRKKKSQYLVGFALETDNELENARGKLRRKNLDLIVLNSLNDPGAGFSVDTNLVTLLDREGNEKKLPLKSKKEVAADIWDYICDRIFSE